MPLIIRTVLEDVKDIRTLPAAPLYAEQKKNGVTLIAVVLQGASGTTAAEAGSLLNYGFDNFQMLSLGDTDFNMLSGGNVYVPVGTATDSLTTKDGTPENGQYTRQYYFGNAPVGPR